MIQKNSINHNKRKGIGFLRFILIIGIGGFVLPNLYYAKYLLKDEKVTAPEVIYNSDSFCVTSYNIRCKTFMDIGKRSWFYRADLIMQNLKTAEADLIGLQEVTVEQFKYLEEHLENYFGIIKYRDNKPWSEGCPIFFNMNRYELVDTKTFWLSETPEVMSKSWNSSNYRICTYVILYDKVRKNQIAVFNAHLDHKSEMARQKGIGLICREISSMIEEMPVILLGDFNAEETSRPYQYISDYLADVKYEALTSMSSDTYNGWGELEKATTIDYIMVTKEAVIADEYRVEKGIVKGTYPSDHFPIVAELRYLK